MSVRISESDLFEACRALFGNDVQLSPDFFSYLQPSGAKSAYRRKVKETHPDLFGNEGSTLQRSRTEVFQKLRSSYETVCDYFKLRDSGLWAPACTPRQPAAQQRTHSGGRYAHQRPPGRAETAASGFLPRQVLQIGLFLYYRRLIDYRLLMEALFWQRRQRPNLGDIALRWGWLSEDEVNCILGVRGAGRRFGEKAVRLDYISQKQLQTLLFYQRSRQQKLGRFFVENALFSHEEMEELARQHREHNQLYGDGSMFRW
ncbi:J domain-containing protein [Syntrophotalea acetylenica]|uniref:Heat shock protein DnaJ domain protein n=1 Tax=Syntrophotalea acetylenica TaxID=29542 RepID=A0A1L3GCB8_SYNAC|nr:J domain-containing protein [Syntrophotalea acetylenica]APG23594.1 hypothetical protein A7E75_00060 [Syntrophotalea acetylenica]APG44171.1 hypothetical protein A6070_08665 [Syntrophotalea acetylenica]